jgi:hypothetical protein
MQRYTQRHSSFLSNCSTVTHVRAMDHKAMYVYLLSDIGFKDPILLTPYGMYILCVYAHNLCAHAYG